MEHLTFGWVDYILFGGLLGVSLLVGVYFGCFSKQDSATEYLYGGKSMAYVPVATSILASLLSGITFLGIPTEVYFHGATFFAANIPLVLDCIITACVFMPIFYDLQVSSSYEYLELRFSKNIRKLASFLYTVSLLLYIPIVIYVPSLAFSQVTGYSIHTISAIFSFVCITYTTMGGVKAVVWTDTIQFVFTIGGLITILTIGVNAVGGIGEVWRIADEGNRLSFEMNPSPLERSTFWGITVGHLFTLMSRFSIGQKFVQRFLAIGRKAEINKAIYLVGVGWLALQTCCVLTGLIVFAKYHKCDPLTAKLISRGDQTLPFYVMDVAGHIQGLPGIFLAGLVSSALSTMSASLNTLSGIIYKDFFDDYIAESRNKDAKSANIMKVISLVIGMVTVALIFLIERLGTIFEMATSLGSIVDGPLLGLFILGVLVPWVGKKGAISGGCAGLAVMTWLVGGIQWHTLNNRIHHSNLPTSVEDCPHLLNETFPLNATSFLPISPEDEPMKLFQISFLYLITLGMLITVVIALFTSLLLGETDLSKIEPRHIAPFLRGLLPEKKYTEVPLSCLPEEKIIK